MLKNVQLIRKHVKRRILCVSSTAGSMHRIVREQLRNFALETNNSILPLDVLCLSNNMIQNRNFALDTNNLS